MCRAEISVDQHLQRHRPIWATNVGHAPPTICERMLHGLGDEFVARRKVAVKPAVAESGFLHEVGEADPIHAALSKSRSRSLDDALVTARFVFLGMAHLRASLGLLDKKDDTRHPHSGG